MNITHNSQTAHSKLELYVSKCTSKNILFGIKNSKCMMLIKNILNDKKHIIFLEKCIFNYLKLCKTNIYIVVNCFWINKCLMLNKSPDIPTTHMATTCIFAIRFFLISHPYVCSLDFLFCFIPCQQLYHENNITFFANLYVCHYLLGTLTL